MKSAKGRGNVRGGSSREVDAASPKSVFVRGSISVFGIGHENLIGKDGGDAEVLVPGLGVVPEGVELGVFPFLEELFPELNLIRISLKNYCTAGLQLVFDAVDDVLIDPVLGPGGVRMYP